MPEEFPDAGPLEAVVHETPWGTRLVPACTALASAERALGEAGRGGASQRLKRGLERLDLAGEVDLVLVDCPPGMTPLTMNALVAADALLVPTQLDFLSVAGLAVLMETVEEVREYDNPALRYLGIVGTMVDERTRHARDIRAQLEQLFGPGVGGVLCRTVIRHSTRVRDAHAAHEAIGQHDPDHAVSRDYRELAARDRHPRPAARRPWERQHERGEAQRRRRRRSRGCSPGRRRPADSLVGSSPPDSARAARHVSADGAGAAAIDRVARPRRVEPARVRLGVVLDEGDVAWLRTTSRPARTGGRRTLGSKFVATGLLTAAIELARAVDIDMHGVDAGDVDELTARCRDALLRAALRDRTNDRDTVHDDMPETIR